MLEVVFVVKLSKEARQLIKAMTSSEKKACLSAARTLYREGLMTYGRYNALSQALQRYKR